MKPDKALLVPIWETSEYSETSELSETPELSETSLVVTLDFHDGYFDDKGMPIIFY